MHDVGKFYAGEHFEKSWQVTTSEASCGDDYRDVVKDITWVVDGPRRKKKKPDKFAVTPMENYALEKIRQLPEGVIVYTFLNQTGNNAGERWCYEITLEDQNTAVQLNTSTGSVRKLHRHTPDTLPVLTTRQVRTYSRSRSPPIHQTLDTQPEREFAASSSYQSEGEQSRSDIGPGFTRLNRETGRWHATRPAVNTSGPDALHEHPATTEMSTDADMNRGVWTQESQQESDTVNTPRVSASAPLTQESQERQSFYPAPIDPFNAFGRTS